MQHVDPLSGMQWSETSGKYKKTGEKKKKLYRDPSSRRKRIENKQGAPEGTKTLAGSGSMGGGPNANGPVERIGLAIPERPKVLLEGAIQKLLDSARASAENKSNAQSNGNNLGPSRPLRGPRITQQTFPEGKVTIALSEIGENTVRRSVLFDGEDDWVDTGEDLDSSVGDDEDPSIEGLARKELGKELEKIDEKLRERRRELQEETERWKQWKMDTGKQGEEIEKAIDSLRTEQMEQRERQEEEKKELRREIERIIRDRSHQREREEEERKRLSKLINRRREEENEEKERKQRFREAKESRQKELQELEDEILERRKQREKDHSWIIPTSPSDSDQSGHGGRRRSGRIIKEPVRYGFDEEEDKASGYRRNKRTSRRKEEALREEMEDLRTRTETLQEGQNNLERKTQEEREKWNKDQSTKDEIIKGQVTQQELYNQYLAQELAGMRRKLEENKAQQEKRVQAIRQENQILLQWQTERYQAQLAEAEKQANEYAHRTQVEHQLDHEQMRAEYEQRLMEMRLEIDEKFQPTVHSTTDIEERNKSMTRVTSALTSMDKTLKEITYTESTEDLRDLYQTVLQRQMTIAIDNQWDGMETPDVYTQDDRTLMQAALTNQRALYKLTWDEMDKENRALTTLVHQIRGNAGSQLAMEWEDTPEQRPEEELKRMDNYIRELKEQPDMEPATCPIPNELATCLPLEVAAQLQEGDQVVVEKRQEGEEVEVMETN